MARQEARHSNYRSLTVWFVNAAVIAAVGLIALALLSACSSDETAATEEETDADSHELVYIPLSYLDIEDDLFGEGGLWGVMINDVPDIVVLHIGDGGIVGEDGKQISQDSLEAGDVIRCSFDMITMSYPGQVSVNEAKFIRHGGEQAIEPFQSAIENYEENASIGSMPDMDNVTTPEG